MIILYFVTLSIISSVQAQQLAGGLGAAINPSLTNSQTTSDLQQALAGPIRQQFIQQTGRNPSMFELVSYRSQVVAGTNYFAKVRTGANDYAHLRIYQSLPYMVAQGQPAYQLDGVQLAKGLNDPIEPFERAAPISSAAGARTGGLGDYQDSQRDSDFRQAINWSLRRQYQQMTGENPVVFDLISYRSQVVAGTLYFAKVRTGNGLTDYAHLRVLQPLPFGLAPGAQAYQLQAVQQGKALNDPIDYFEQNMAAPVRNLPVETSTMPMPGGLGGAQQGDVALARAIAGPIRQQYQQMTNTNPPQFDLISYRSQVVAGMSYFAKVRLGSGPFDYAHLRILQPLPYMVSNGALPYQLVNIQTGKQLSSELEYFTEDSILNVASSVTTTTTRRPLLGGLGAAQPVDSSSQQDLEFRQALAGSVRQQFVIRTNLNPAQFDLISYRTQVVAGTNYFAKVRIGQGPQDYVHLRIFKPLPHMVQSGQDAYQLVGVQGNKGLNDAIEYFDNARTSVQAPVTLGGNVRTSMVGQAQQPDASQNQDEVAQLRAALAGTIRQQYIIATGMYPERFDLHTYLRQVVAGTNFFAKVQLDTSGRQFAHLKIFRSLNGEWRLIGGQLGKGPTDPISYF